MYLIISTQFQRIPCCLHTMLYKKLGNFTYRSRPTKISYHIPNTLVHTHFLQLFVSILMEHPILKKEKTRCIMKIQKRSESNVLSKLSINKSIESKRLRKWLIPSTIDDPWSWAKQKIKGHFFFCFTSRKGRFFLYHFLEKTLEINF